MASERSSSFKESKTFSHSTSIGAATPKFGFGVDSSYKSNSFRKSKESNSLQVFSVESGEVFVSKVL